MEEASAAAQFITEKNSQDTTVAVFDLQDRNIRYSPNGDISRCEQVVQTFFSHSTDLKGNAKTVHTLFHDSLKVDYILCEGSLKESFLAESGLEEPEINYLNSREGAEKFCGITEYFMHGMKLGHTIRTPSNSILPAERYFKALTPNGTPYKPKLISTVLYPKDYIEMYSTTGNYANSIMDVFHVLGKYDSATKITHLKTWLKV